MKPCKHLDYTTRYIGCEIVTLDGFSCPVRYWQRNVVLYPEAPRKVQFCGQGRGRINAVFDCYDGSMSCYEPAAEREGKGADDAG